MAGEERIPGWWWRMSAWERRSGRSGAGSGVALVVVGRRRERRMAARMTKAAKGGQVARGRGGNVRCGMVCVPACMNNNR